jgi:hypothetical protein
MQESEKKEERPEEKSEVSTQLVPSIVFDVHGAAQAVKQWERVERELLGPNDTYLVKGVRMINKSGWRKIALAANVTTEIVSVLTNPDNAPGIITPPAEFSATVIARAKASWGRVSEDVGTYSASEFLSKTGERLPVPKATVIARAATRAINRAISDLVGGGRVSAEEVEYPAEAEAPTQQQEAKTEQKETEEPATEFQLRYVAALTKSDVAKGILSGYLKVHGLSDINQLTKKQASELIDKLRTVSD